MDVKRGYKQTEVGVIPEDWEVKSLDSITKIFGGGTPSTTVDEYWDGQIPWVSAGDVSQAGGRYIHDTIDHISELGLASCPAQIMPSGTTIIIARGATVGRMAQLGKAMAFNQTCYGLIPLSELDQNYLYYTMLFSIDSVKALTYGTIFGTITTNSFKQWKIPFPPTKAEQQAIAEALSDVDGLISALDALIAKKRAIKQGAMQELLTGQRRLPGFAGEWAVKMLGELGNKFLNGGTPSTQQEEYWQGDIPWITGADVVNQQVSEVRKFITEEAVKNSATNVVEKGNLLIVTRTGVGKLAIAPFDLAISQDLTGIYVKSELAIPEYLYRFFDYNSEKLKNLNQGTSIAGITRETLIAMKVSLPPLAEQTAIAQLLADMDGELAALAAKRAKTVAVKAGMMQTLLTGQVRLV